MGVYSPDCRNLRACRPASASSYQTPKGRLALSHARGNNASRNSPSGTSAQADRRGLAFVSSAATVRTSDASQTSAARVASGVWNEPWDHTQAATPARTRTAGTTASAFRSRFCVYGDTLHGHSRTHRHWPASIAPLAKIRLKTVNAAMRGHGSAFATWLWRATVTSAPPTAPTPRRIGARLFTRSLRAGRLSRGRGRERGRNAPMPATSSNAAPRIASGTRTGSALRGRRLL